MNVPTTAPNNLPGDFQLQKAFTVRQVTRALGISRQAVYNRLADVRSSPLNGENLCPFDLLPLDWQLRITKRGIKRGFENGEDYLRSISTAAWRPALPWSQVSTKEQIKAAQLQRALTPALALRAEPHVSAAQVEQAALRGFKTEFGYEITARHLRRLVARTVERDGGDENWQRLEIYLDERAFAVRKPAARQVLENEYQHRNLDEVFETLENRQDPTADDRQYLWDAVFRHYEQASPSVGRDRRVFKASLLDHIFKAFPPGTLCSSSASLKRRFDEKYKQWQDGGRVPSALQDKRPLNSGRFRQAEFVSDLAAIRDRAILHDGNIALAYNLLHEEGKLSREFCEFYPYVKGEVPGAVRAAVDREVRMCLPIRRGPWQARMRGPFIQRDWSDVRPGDWFCADDVTWNHYFKEQSPDGGSRIHRGECLLMTDLRTGYPLDFLLIAGHYNGEHIRSLALRVHDRVGLPRKGFYFERGVWCSNVVVGDKKQGTPVHWRDAENGLCSMDLGLEVRHATTPRAKPIEGQLRIIQERMRCIPGFIGFNERTEEHEREQELIARANNGDPAALRRFPTQAEWAASISKVLENFAEAQQEGVMLDGKSPVQAWTEEIPQHPLRKLSDELRYVLSTHKKEVTVRQEGIVLIIRGQRRIYFNEDTGRLIGQRVLAFYNLEMPELLTVSNMERTSYFSVRAVQLPAMSATREQLDEVNRLRNAHMAPAKAIFSSIKHPVVSTITRDNEHGVQMQSLGKFINTQAAVAKSKDTERARKLRALRERAVCAGVNLSTSDVRNPDDALQALDRLKHFESQMEAEEQDNSRDSQ